MVRNQEFHLKLGDPTSVEFKHLEGLLVHEVSEGRSFSRRKERGTDQCTF